MHIAVLSHIGPRPDNQDSAAGFELAVQRANDGGGQPVVDSAAILTVHDGVGSAPCGREAAHYGSALLLERLAAGLCREASQPRGWRPERLEALCKEAVASENQWLCAQREESGAQEPTHVTTLALVVHAGDAAVVAHCGDSPVFLWRGGALQKLTEEHSHVARLLKAGKIGPRTASVHPDRNVITKALGIRPDVGADFKVVRTEPGDLFLLATDGITGVLDENQIAGIIEASAGLSRKQPELTTCAQSLVEAALQAGTGDNASIALGYVVPSVTRVTEVLYLSPPLLVQRAAA